MRSIPLILALVVCLGALADEPKPDAEGFVPLFNTKDLKGWRVMGNAEGFKVDNGAIRSESGSGAQCMYYTKKEFSDFILRVEWRVSAKGNSGVFIRTPQIMDPWARAYEVQISCEEPRRDNSHCTGALYGYVAVEPRPDETPEKWRTYEITCKGPHITVKVDGVKVCELDQTTKPETKDKALKGFIGLQDSHGPEGTWIEYRTVKIREL